MNAVDQPNNRVVTAVVLEWRGRVALLRRSQETSHDRGKWHCITGYVDSGADPRDQAIIEIFEETELQAENLFEIKDGPVLRLCDNAGQPWLVHTFAALSSEKRLQLNWEHDAFRWVDPKKAKRFSNRVSWLDDVLVATGHIVL